MKKTTMLLAIALVVGISLVAYAGATKFTLTQGKAATDTESGFAIVNDDTDEEQTIIQFQVRGMAPGTYWAYYKYPSKFPVVLGQLKVNKRGHGHYHANVPILSRWYWLGVSNTPTGITQYTAILYTKVS